MNPKDYFHHDALCPLPWTGVFVNPDGEIRNCAITSEKLGNLHDASMQDILTGPTNVAIKTDMLNHVRHARCQACYKVEDLSNSAMASGSNRSWYKKYGIKNLDVYDSPNNFELKIVDLRWRNTCNMACVYCGPDVSSLWASELGTMDYNIDDAVLERNKKYIFDQIDTIDHVYLAGGEPLLIVENLELLNLLAKHKPNVEIRINTNLSVVDNKIFKKLLEFKNVKWTISVDAMIREYNYIRYPGNWDRFYQNLMDLKNKNFDINFNMVWCILNAHSIFDCIEHFQKIGFHDNAFIIQCLDNPQPLNVKNLPDSELDKLKSIIKNKLATTQPEYWLHKSLEIMYNYIDAPYSSKDLVGTLGFLRTLDDRRILDSRAVFPFLYNL